LLRELAVARMEAEAAREELLVGREAARYEALRYDQLLTAERQSTATLTKELDAVRADLEQARAQLTREAKGASRVRQAGETEANKERETAARERAKGAVLEQDLLVARREIDVLKNRAQSIAGREEALRRELAAAREQLDAMRHAADVASAQARAVAEMTAEQKHLREEQQQRAEGLAGDLRLAQRQVESLKAKEVLAMRESAAVRRARHAAEAALAEARRALDEERHKIGLYERDLALARQSIDALEARAKLTAAALATGQAAESAVKQAAEALALERARTDSVARALDAARQERDEAREELSRLTAAQRKALDQERDRVSTLSRDLTAARRQIDKLKTREVRDTADNMPKARAADRAKPRASTPARKGVRQIKVQKPPRTVRLTKVLPDALLPTQPAIPGRWP
jgi:chromosome segregation ATPase